MGRNKGSKNKNCIEYVCPTCLKNFNHKKYNYEAHIKRKNPCKPINIDFNEGKPESELEQDKKIIEKCNFWFEK